VKEFFLVGTSKCMEQDYLVSSEEDKTQTATRKSCLEGCFCMSLAAFGLAPISLSQLILASQINWRWGMSIAVIGAAEGILCLAQSYFPRMRMRMNRSVKVLSRTVKLQNVLVLTANVLFWYMLMTVIIQLIPQMRRSSFVDFNSVGFPASCPPDSINCVRLGNNTDTYRAGSLRSPKVPGGLKEVQQGITDWINSHGGTVTFRDEHLIRARFVTLLMGYLDDFATYSFCDKDGNVNVNMQSQSRIGKSDLNKNYERISDLVQTLIETCSSKKEKFPCGKSC